MIFPIRRKMIDEKHGLVFLLSVVQTNTGTAAIWSHHKYEGDAKKTPIEYFQQNYQAEHDRQIRDIILKDVLNEPEEYKVQTVQDLTQFG